MAILINALIILQHYNINFVARELNLLLFDCRSSLRMQSSDTKDNKMTVKTIQLFVMMINSIIITLEQGRQALVITCYPAIIPSCISSTSSIRLY